MIGRQGHLAAAEGREPGDARRPDRLCRPRAGPGRAAPTIPGRGPVPPARRGAGAGRPARAGVGAGRRRASPARRRRVVGRTTVGAADHLPGTRASAVAAGAVRRESAISAWLPIVYGCDKTCTYCIVPFSRGPERSRPVRRRSSTRRGRSPPPATARSRSSARTSTRTATTCRPSRGSPTSTRIAGPAASWTFTAGPDLAALIRAIDGIRTADGVPAIARLRFVTSHPWDLSDRLIAAMAECPSVCAHLHLPVQSGDDAVLRRMGRQYTVEHYLERLARIREAVPGIAISTDVIVGFCGETDAQFRSTLAPPRDRPLRPGLRSGVLRATRHAGDPSRRRRPACGEAGAAERAAGAPGGDRARAEPCLGRARGRGARRHGDAAATSRPRRGRARTGDAPRRAGAGSARLGSEPPEQARPSRGRRGARRPARDGPDRARGPLRAPRSRWSPRDRPRRRSS